MMWKLQVKIIFDLNFRVSNAVLYEKLENIEQLIGRRQKNGQQEPIFLPRKSVEEVKNLESKDKNTCNEIVSLLIF